MFIGLGRKLSLFQIVYREGEATESAYAKVPEAGEHTGCLADRGTVAGTVQGYLMCL